MARPSRLLAVWLLALALVAVAGAGPAGAAGTIDVYTDYADNGAIDGDHTPADLLDALELAEGDAQYDDFASAVQGALDREILGVSSGAEAPELTPAVEQPSDGSPLPEPRSPDGGLPPWPFLALSALAVALIVSGAGSSLYRRARR